MNSSYYISGCQCIQNVAICSHLTKLIR